MSNKLNCINLNFCSRLITLFHFLKENEYVSNEFVDNKFDNNILAKVGAGIRLNMKNKTLITGSKGSILVNSPWLPEKKSLVEIKTNKRYYKSFINSKKSIFANQIKTVCNLILDGKREGEFPSMTWKNSINNMRILEEWKKQLFKKLQ